jgi:hypothetical protein
LFDVVKKGKTMPKLSWQKSGIFTVLLVLGLLFLFDSKAMAVESAKISTGDFRWRSYLRVNHPRFRNSPQGKTFFAAPSCPPIASGKIHRFVDGIDACLTTMSDADTGRQLNDAFATSLLRKGLFPANVDAVATAVMGAGLNLQQANYLVGEGSQIATTIAARDEPRNLRYVLSWGATPSSAQIFLSAAPGGDSSFLQAIAWDATARKYNFYEFREQVGLGDGTSTKVWSWAGESAMAQATATMGHGCFDCHHNGVGIMKELNSPWNNWQSQQATISPLVVPLAVAQEKFFGNLNGAEVLEKAIRSGFLTYYRGWLGARYQSQGNTVRLTDVDLMLRRLTMNTTVNFMSSGIQSNGNNTSPPDENISGIPNDFLLWDSALRTALNVQYTIPNIILKRQDYDNYLAANKFKLVQSKLDGLPLYQQPGSTYFSLFIPVPPAEDLYLLTQMRSNKIVTDKFIAAILMVDFQNPVFSTKRASLQQYAQGLTTGTITSGVSTVPTDFAAKVNTVAVTQASCDAATNFDRCTAEQQFMYIWNLADNDWNPQAKRIIQAYLDKFTALTPTELLATIGKSVAQRQQQFKSQPTIQNLNEFSLLLPVSDLAN